MSNQCRTNASAPAASFVIASGGRVGAGADAVVASPVAGGSDGLALVVEAVVLGCSDVAGAGPVGIGEPGSGSLQPVSASSSTAAAAGARRRTGRR